jgi:hypothetical protein
MSRKKIVAAIAATFVLGIAAASCAETPEESDEPAAVATGEDSTEKSTESEETTSQADEADPTTEEAPAETAGQQNARESAESYLEYSAFSRKGLIQQLKYEGYSTKDATYAVDAVGANWNKQAAKAAKDYLDYSSFSRSGLIEQLEYEGYTHRQAVYGVNKTGL